MKAMAGEQKQKKKAMLKAPRTPKKENRPEKFVIGSSSTWKNEQLERFEVQIGGQVGVKEMIPEKWFDFRGLEHYQSGLLIFVCDTLTYSALSARLHSTRRPIRRQHSPTKSDSFLDGLLHPPKSRKFENHGYTEG